MKKRENIVNEAQIMNYACFQTTASWLKLPFFLFLFCLKTVIDVDCWSNDESSVLDNLAGCSAGRKHSSGALLGYCKNMIMFYFMYY